MRTVGMLSDVLNADKETSDTGSAFTVQAPEHVFDGILLTCIVFAIGATEEVSVEEAAAAVEKRTKLRSKFLRNIVLAQGFVEPSPLSMQQQSAAISGIASNPSELDAGTIRKLC